MADTLIERIVFCVAKPSAVHYGKRRSLLALFLASLFAKFANFFALFYFFHNL